MAEVDKATVLVV